MVGSLLAGGCSENAPPVIDPIDPQTATVGVDMRLFVSATDPDGDAVTFRVEVPTLPDLHDRAHPPRFDPYGRSAAYLHWVPLASDVGVHEFHITASDGKDESEITFTVTVQSGNAVPVFRKPLGDGTTLDLARQSCLDVDVVVEDPDSAEVTISLEEPVEEGYEFTQDGPTEGTFSWCPTQKQIDAQDRYTLNLLAQDPEGHAARKKYLIVLRKALDENCPGEAPTVSVTWPQDVSSFDDITVQARVSDDKGLAGPPVLYFSLQEPADPAHPDFSLFDQVSMELVSGDEKSGTYEGRIPNPVVTEPPGTTKTIYAFVEATDDDDATGDCDHRTRAPDDQVATIKVTRPSGSGTFQFCRTCWADVQCGTQGLCVIMGSANGFCLQRCDDGEACPADSTCTQGPVESIDGTTGRVCVPNSGTCEQECRDDGMEDNDDFLGAEVVEVNRTYTGLRLCGNSSTGIDEDYYWFELTESANVTCAIHFLNSDGDLDLELLDENEQVLGRSASVSDDEVITTCLQPGIYSLRVYSMASYVNAAYALEVQAPPGGCCTDDPLEPDNDAGHAHPVQAGDIFEDMWICPGNDDWYSVYLEAGQTVVVDLLFDQQTENQDLDLHFYDRDGWTDLTPCPPCDLDNGQSGTSDEHMEYTVQTAGTYFVIVRGYENSQNTYVIGFDIR